MSCSNLTEGEMERRALGVKRALAAHGINVPTGPSCGPRHLIVAGQAAAEGWATRWDHGARQSSFQGGERTLEEEPHPRVSPWWQSHPWGLLSDRMGYQDI